MRSKSMFWLGGLIALAIASAAMLGSPGGSQHFSISVFPGGATVRAGGVAKYTAIVNSQGFVGRVALTCRSLEAGADCSVSPASVEINPELTPAVEVRGVAGKNAGAGSYQLIITANPDDGTAEKRAVVMLRVR